MSSKKRDRFKKFVKPTKLLLMTLEQSNQQLRDVRQMPKLPQVSLYKQKRYAEFLPELSQLFWYLILKR